MGKGRKGRGREGGEGKGREGREGRRKLGIGREGKGAYQAGMARGEPVSRNR